MILYLRLTGYYNDNALECRAKYLLLVNFLKLIKLFFKEFCRRFFSSIIIVTILFCYQRKKRRTADGASSQASSRVASPEPDTLALCCFCQQPGQFLLFSVTNQVLCTPVSFLFSVDCTLRMFPQLGVYGCFTLQGVLPPFQIIFTCLSYESDTLALCCFCQQPGTFFLSFFFWYHIKNFIDA